MKSSTYGPHDQSTMKDRGNRNGNGKGKQDIGILRKGDQVVLPADMDLGRLIGILQRKSAEEEMDRCIMETISVSPHEGAIALAKAVKTVFGISTEPGGSAVSVAVGVGQTMAVRWGMYELPMGGYVEPEVATEDGRYVFKLHAHVKGKHEHVIRNLIEKTRNIATAESPYRGKAFSLILTDDEGDRLEMPKIHFLDLPANETVVILREDIERDLRTCIWGIIRNTDQVRKMGTPLRRNLLLAGEYGTGKTLTATRTAQIATKHGWTFIYAPKASDLPQILDLARQYEPCIVFVEDIDRLTGGTRTDAVNTVINALDGIGNKSSEVMVVFTTNHADKINAAMRRPGRIDTAINLLPPDASTAVRLVIHYAGTFLAPEQDLSLVGEKLAGKIPAQIREVVERAKLAVSADGKEEISITSADLIYATGFIEREHELFANKGEGQAASGQEVLHALGHQLIAVTAANGNGSRTGNGSVREAELARR